MSDYTLALRVKLGSDHRVTLPDDYCKDMGLKKGSILELQRIGPNKDKVLITVLVK
jgi:bifunctional DNA-binding transcriptional regulator/antitoxin component of YhaV-PrlF toxin-antitoxin module